MPPHKSTPATRAPSGTRSIGSNGWRRSMPCSPRSDRSVWMRSRAPTSSRRSPPRGLRGLRHLAASFSAFGSSSTGARRRGIAQATIPLSASPRSCRSIGRRARIMRPCRIRKRQHLCRRSGRLMRAKSSSSCLSLRRILGILAHVRNAERHVERDRHGDEDLDGSQQSNRMKGRKRTSCPRSRRDASRSSNVRRPLSDGGPHAFPGRSPKKPLSNMVFLMALRRMKRTDLTAHGFRSTFRRLGCRAHEIVPRAACEAALAAIRSGTRPRRPTTVRTSSTIGET